MNLLDKNWYGLLIIVTLTIFSCEESHDIGLGLDPDIISIEVLYTELPLEATNIRIDSIRSDNDTRLLIGKNTDPIFGTTRSILYSQLSFTSGVLIPSDDHKYIIDSTVINLDIDKVHSSDIDVQTSIGPLPTQHFDIYQLTDTLFSTGNYLSNFNTPYRTDKKEGSFDLELNSDRIRDKDSLTYTIQFRLSDGFGEELFDIATEVQGSSVSPAGALKYEHKGIAIVGSESNTLLLGIKPLDSTNITIHYHEVDPFIENNISTDSIYADSLMLTVSMASFFYNKITTDRTGSLMANENGDYNSFDTGDGNVYLQPASGIFPKLSFDTLTQFFLQHPNIQINRLELVAETAQNNVYNENVRDLRYLYIKEADGSKINTAGLITNVLFETAVMTDNGYLARIPEILISNLDETSLTYEGYPTFFGQLVETGSLEIDHSVVMPIDMTTPDFSVFDASSGFKIRLYYTLPQ